jgi:hypothetical protein
MRNLCQTTNVGSGAKLGLATQYMIEMIYHLNLVATIIPNKMNPKLNIDYVVSVAKLVLAAIISKEKRY